MAARPRSPFVTLCLCALFAPFLAPGCSNDDGGTTPDDSTAPAAITDLTVQTVGTTSVTLRWSAPGDDGATGSAATYDLRFMVGDASVFSWNSATPVSGTPTPLQAGTIQSYAVQGLTTGTSYTFAIKAADEKPNWSAISNLVSAQPGGGASGCQVSPTSLDFGEVTVGATSDRTFTITNTGSQSLTGTVAETCAPFSVLSGGGAYTLDAAEVRTVTVRYAPTSAGSHTCTVDTGTATCADVSCAGTGTGGSASCAVSPTTLMFALTEVNAFRVMEFYITNDGSASISGNVSSGCDPFQVMTGSGAYTLDPGEWRTVIVRFAPSAEGNYTCTIDTGLAECADVSCSGTCGSLPPGCTVNPPILLFPDTAIGSSLDLDFEIINDTEATITGNVVSECSTFSVVTGGGAYSLSPGEMRDVTVRYAPASHGTHTCVIRTGLPCVDVGCAGTSVETNENCFVYPLVILDFSQRFTGTWEEKTFNIQNFGGGTLTGTVGPCSAPFEVVSGGGSYSLGQGQIHPVTVRFAPTTAGTYTCELDTGTGCTNVGCVGIGLAADQPICGIDPPTLSFPDTEVGSTSDRTFTIRNIGSGTLTGSVSEGCDVYTILSGGGSYSLGAGQSRAVTVRYAPSTPGHHTCSIDTGSALCSDVECDGTATGGTPTCLVAPTSLSFPDTPVGSGSERSFTITNSGSGILYGSVTESCGAFSILNGGGPYTLTAGQSTTVTIQFSPLSAGVATCDITTGGSCPAVTCSGTGTQESPECAIDHEEGLDFPATLIGELSYLSFTITNTGTGTLNGTVTESCSVFDITEGGGTYSLGPQESRTVTVRFAPTEEMEYTCTVNPGSSCSSLVCRGTGASVPSDDMVLVPAGTFTMGSDEEEGADGERPEHTPHISAYYIDTYEVSNLQYATALTWAMDHDLILVADENPYGIVYNAAGNLEPFLYMDQYSDDNNQCRITYAGAGGFGVDSGWDANPVVYVTWWGAAAYCNWRSAMAGRTPCYDTATWVCNFSANGYRLPTEAEWEKAARGGSDERTYPWGEGAISCDRCNYGPDWPTTLCISYTAAVNDPQYASGVSPYGVWQMAGNVWEWCNDWGSFEYYAESPASDPTGPGETGYRVVRGGGWWDGEFHQRCANRSSDDPISSYDRLGFRTVRRP